MYRITNPKKQHEESENKQLAALLRARGGGSEGLRAGVRLSTTRPLPYMDYYGLRSSRALPCRRQEAWQDELVGWEALHGPQTCKTRRAPEPAAAQSCPRVRPAIAAVRTEPSEPWSRAGPEVTTWVGLGLGSNPNPSPNPNPNPSPSPTPNPNPHLVW